MRYQRSAKHLVSHYYWSSTFVVGLENLTFTVLRRSSYMKVMCNWGILSECDLWTSVRSEHRVEVWNHSHSLMYTFEEWTISPIAPACSCSDRGFSLCLISVLSACCVSRPALRSSTNASCFLLLLQQREKSILHNGQTLRRSLNKMRIYTNIYIHINTYTHIYIDTYIYFYYRCACFRVTPRFLPWLTCRCLVQQSPTWHEAMSTARDTDVEHCRF